MVVAETVWPVTVSVHVRRGPSTAASAESATAPPERLAPVPTSCVSTSAVVVDPEPPVGLPQEMADDDVVPEASACAAGGEGGTSAE